MSDFKYVGKRIPAINGKPKSMGAAKYPSDMKYPDALVGKCILSTRTHANIKSIDTSEAEKLPGVKAIVTYKNSSKEIFNPSMQKYIGRLPIDHEDMMIFSKKARYIGDMLGAIAAVDEETALKAIDLVKIEYEDLDASTNPFDAMKEGAALVHDDVEGNISLTFPHLANTGDADTAFEESDVIVEITDWIHTSRQHVIPLEPLTCTAYMQPDGELTVWSSVQRPHAARKGIADIFGIQDSKVNVVCEYAGGFFGEAHWPVIPPAVALALKTGEPVRVEFSKEEFMSIVPCREVVHTKGKMGFKKDGTLIVGKQDLIADAGAYHNRAGHIGVVCMAAFSGSYRMPSFEGLLKTVYSNTPSTGGSRGYGTPQGALLNEMLMDKAAKELGIDRLELRCMNMKGLGEQCGGVFPAEVISQEKILRLAAEKMSYEEKKNRPTQEGKIRHGIGMATFFDSSGGQPIENSDRHCTMTLEEDGTVTIANNHADGGMNLLGASAAMVAETLSIKMEEVNYVHKETKGTLYEFGLAANSGAYVLGNMHITAANRLKQQILEAVEYEYDIDVDDLDIYDSAVWNMRTDEKIGALKEIATHILYHHDEPGKYCSVKQDYTPLANPNAVGACMVDVSIDIETGDIKIDKLVYVHDIGRAINPLVVEGQIQGGLALGVAYALYEDMSLDPKTGAVRASNYNTYRVPCALDLPEFDIIVYENPAPSGPFGAKGVGMSGVIGVPGAINCAINDAIGSYIMDMPFTPERILKAIKEKGIK